jgi:hypothetical protein
VVLIGKKQSQHVPMQRGVTKKLPPPWNESSWNLQESAGIYAIFWYRCDKVSGHILVVTTRYQGEVTKNNASNFSFKYHRPDLAKADSGQVFGTRGFLSSFDYVLISDRKDIEGENREPLAFFHLWGYSFRRKHITTYINK